MNSQRLETISTAALTAFLSHPDFDVNENEFDCVVSDAITIAKQLIAAVDAETSAEKHEGTRGIC